MSRNETDLYIELVRIPHIEQGRNNGCYCTFQVFNIRYLEMHKMQGAKCAISKLMYGLFVCTDDNHSLMLVAYRHVHTDEPYIDLHMYAQMTGTIRTLFPDSDLVLLFYAIP